MRPAACICCGEIYFIFCGPACNLRFFNPHSSIYSNNQHHPSFMSPRRQGDTALYLTLDSQPSASKVAPRYCTPYLQAWSLKAALRVTLSLVAILCIFQFRLWSLNVDDSPKEQPQSIYSGSQHDHLRYTPSEPPMARTMSQSSWTCTHEGASSLGAKKSRQCVVQHVCVDDDGMFLLSKSNDSTMHLHGFPNINLLSAPDSALNQWKPRFKYIANIPTSFYRNETVFVYGLFQPRHFSHFLYDGLLPLYSTMKRFQGTANSWFLRQADYVGENTVGQAVWEMDAITSGKELVLKPFEVVSSFQVMPPKSAPMCFERAVIGLGSQCGLGYCAENTPIEVYKAYRDQIQDYYMSSSTRWNEFVDHERRLYKTSAFSPMKCVDTARYYNFQHPTAGIEAGDEPEFRQGIRDPDASDPSAPPPNSSPVVAIIERRGTRSVINLDKLIEKVIAKGFRLKVMTYDQGCGIPQVAYMMRDINILISPHGNALGGSLWMPDKPFPLVVSIDTTKYQESWFMMTTTVLAQRIIIHRCGPKHSTSLPAESTCPYVRDLDLARKYLKQLDWALDQDTAEDDLMALTGPEYPIELFDKYGGEKLHPFLTSYWKNLSRYVDTDRLMALLEQVRKENMQDADKSYLQVCEEGRCCGPICEGVLSRNVVGPLSAYGQKMNAANWGEHKSGGSDGQVAGYDWIETHPGQTLKSWVA